MSASSSSAPSAAATAALKSSARSLQSYIGRLPLLTRAVAFAIPIVHVLSWFGAPLADMWALDPAKMDLTQSTAPEIRGREGMHG